MVKELIDDNLLLEGVTIATGKTVYRLKNSDFFFAKSIMHSYTRFMKYENLYLVETFFNLDSICMPFHSLIRRQEHNIAESLQKL